MEKNLRAALWAAILIFFSSLSVCPAGSAGAAPSPESSAQYRCLAVGMDLFVTEPDTVPCSANNVETVSALLADCLPEGTAVTRRVNGPGTCGALEELIGETFGEAREEDVSFLYFSTHGICWEEEGKTRSALILSDGEQEEALEPEALRAMLESVPGRKVLILDCCYAGAISEAFRGPEWRVLAACGGEEKSYFRAVGEETGIGFFTAALETALRAGDPEQTDPDGSGDVSMAELARRIRNIYGVSSPAFWPEEDETPLFLLPEEGHPERLQGLAFSPQEAEEDAISLSFRFRTETAVRIEYRLIPMGDYGWDFSRAVRIPDRERTGQTRGLLSPGEKQRTVRISRERLGEKGAALLEIVSFRGVFGQVPVAEATAVVGEKGTGVRD